jgi:tetratricopeptide (TPR) repeat protein
VCPLISLLRDEREMKKPKYLERFCEDRDSTEARLRRFLASGDTRPSVRFALAGVLIDRKEFVTALAELETVSPDFTNDHAFWWTYGLCHLLLGNFERGVEALRRSLELDPARCQVEALRDSFVPCQLFKMAGLLGDGQADPKLKDPEYVWKWYWGWTIRSWKES